MRGWFATRFRAAIAAAASLTGKRFGLLVASSVVATSAIVAAAATNQPEASPLASLLGHSLAADLRLSAVTRLVFRPRDQQRSRGWKIRKFCNKICESRRTLHP